MPETNNTLFSVIIPTHNRENLVCEAVESVLAQSFHDLELIVVDDASTDHTGIRLNKFDDKRIQILQRDTQGGPSIARNDGAGIACGKWLAFLDSDDLWLPGKLQAQKDYFDSRKIS